ncbi:MAG TPA: biopolymer transporter ExbD [Methylococcaceae bacterium]|nr:biopolymer transporter ExbD [Methylococcaceae bacterium]
MAFKSEDSSGEAMSEINVTPLVDVMLVLLVVFIVTAPLLTQAVHVKLPKTEKTESLPDPKALTLSIGAQGELTVNEQPQPWEGLEERLRNQAQSDPEMTVQFQADAAVPYGKVAEAMAIAQHAGVTKLGFIMQEK